MASNPVFLRRVGLQNYRSIGRCSVELRPVNFLVGKNGSGKSNFLDALRFVANSLETSVEHALRERGGIGEVRRRSSGHPTHFGVRLDWTLPSGDHGTYAFRIGAMREGGFEVQRESCQVNFADLTVPPSVYEVRSGKVHECSLRSPPAAAIDRLFLVAVSGQPEFRPLYDGLLGMTFYNLIPNVIRELQSPSPGEVLAADGHNLASVLKRLAIGRPDDGMGRLVELLAAVVPGVQDVAYRAVGKKETLEFRQEMAGSRESWRFDAENMSDGTLRALGILVALYQTPAVGGRAVRLVGIEEPETALHPGAAAVLRSALFEASEERQIVVTSHSPDLLDDKRIMADHLISVVSHGGQTVLGAVDAASRTSMRDQLFTAGELLRLDQLGSEEAGLDKDPALQPELFDQR